MLTRKRRAIDHKESDSVASDGAGRRDVMPRRVVEMRPEIWRNYSEKWKPKTFIGGSDVTCSRDLLNQAYVIYEMSLSK